MVDTHCHVIYGIDDGSKNEEMTRSMLRLAVESGTQKIFATPHVVEIFDKPSWNLIQEKVEDLRTICAEENLALEIYPAAEVMMNWELLSEIGASGAYCINAGMYILVELPMGQIPNYAEDFWYELELKGLKPILAHPERYHGLNENLDLLLKWRQRGVLFQINSGSLVGKFGTKVEENAKFFVKQGLMDFLGSDAHREHGRDTNMQVAVKVLQEMLSLEACTKILVENPEAVINNQQFDIFIPDTLRKIGPKKSFWQKLFS